MPLVDRKSRSGSKSQKSIGFEFTDGGWSWWSMSRIVRWWNGNQELHMSTLLVYWIPERTACCSNCCWVVLRV